VKTVMVVMKKIAHVMTIIVVFTTAVIPSRTRSNAFSMIVRRFVEG
jgi:hypothetical protein